MSRFLLLLILIVCAIESKSQDESNWSGLIGASGYNIYSEGSLTAVGTDLYLTGFNMTPSMGLEYSWSKKNSVRAIFEYALIFGLNSNNDQYYTISSDRKLWQIDYVREFDQGYYISGGFTLINFSAFKYYGVQLGYNPFPNHFGPKFGFGLNLDTKTRIEVSADMLVDLSEYEVYLVGNFIKLRLTKSFGGQDYNPIVDSKFKMNLRLSYELAHGQYEFTDISNVLGLQVELLYDPLKVGVFWKRSISIDALPYRYLGQSSYVVSNNVGILRRFGSNQIGLSYFFANNSELRRSDVHFSEIFNQKGIGVSYMRSLNQFLYGSVQFDFNLNSSRSTDFDLVIPQVGIGMVL